MSGGAGVTCSARPTRGNWPRVFMSLKRRSSSNQQIGQITSSCNRKDSNDGKERSDDDATPSASSRKLLCNEEETILAEAHSCHLWIVTSGELFDDKRYRNVSSGFYFLPAHCFLLASTTSRTFVIFMCHKCQLLSVLFV